MVVVFCCYLAFTVYDTKLGDIFGEIKLVEEKKFEKQKFSENGEPSYLQMDKLSHKLQFSLEIFINDDAQTR